MKVTVDQISEGVARYVDMELVPKVPGLRKWVLGAFGGYAVKMVKDKAMESREMLESAGLMDADGLVDLDALYSSLRKTAGASGPVTEHLPMLGDVTFDSSDIDKLYTYIRN